MKDTAVHETEEALVRSRRDTHYTNRARRAVVFREAGRAYGAGTPYPSTPHSESSYDGTKCFDDCEPWVLR